MVGLMLTLHASLSCRTVSCKQNHTSLSLHCFQGVTAPVSLRMSQTLGGVFNFHDTSMILIPVQVHPGSLLFLCICLRDYSTISHNRRVSHTCMSSSQ